MKKIILTLVLSLGFCITSFSQSNNGIIDGYFTVILGQPSTYMVNTENICKSYEWEVNTNLTNSKSKKGLGTLQITGNKNEQFLTIEPTEIGIFSIQVVYTDDKGFHTASFVGNVISPEQIITTESSLTYLDDAKKEKK